MDEFCAETGFDRILGFMHPMSQSPLSEHSQLESLFSHLPAYVQNGGLREEVERLAHFDLPSDVFSLRRAFVMLTFITHVYVRGVLKHEQLLSTIPLQISEPLIAMSGSLGVQPIVSFASTAQFNVLPFTEETTDDNLPVFGSATGTPDEVWFYKCSVMIERCAPRFIELTLKTMQDLQDNNNLADAAESMATMVQLLDSFSTKLSRVREHCKPALFYNNIRPYLAGWKHDPLLPKGVQYGNAGHFSYVGGNAGQSPLMQLVDIVLGIEHAGDFCSNMFACMPTSDQVVLRYFKGKSSLRALSMACKDKAVIAQFNRVVRAVYRFRDLHLTIVSEYIIKPASEVNGSDRGTGGSDPIKLLRQFRSETQNALIKDE